MAGHTNNGVFVYSGNPPVRADMTLNCSENGSVVIDPVTAATDADGGTIIVLDHAFYAPDHGRAVLDTGAGTLTYIPDRNFTGTDEMYVFLYDGEGKYDTVKITISVQ